MYTSTMRDVTCYCENCGAVIPKGSLFCENCGCPVPETELEPMRQGNNRFHRSPLIAAAAVMVVLAGCMSGFIFGQPHAVEASHTDKYHAVHRYVDENTGSDEGSDLDLVSKQPKEENFREAQEPKHIDQTPKPTPKPVFHKDQKPGPKTPEKPKKKDLLKTEQENYAKADVKDRVDPKPSRNQDEGFDGRDRGRSDDIVDPVEPEDPEEAEPEKDKALSDRIIDFFDSDEPEDEEDVDNDKDQDETEVNDDEQDETEVNDDEQDETADDEDETEDDEESVDDENLDSDYENEDDDDYEEWQCEY